ncbi:MAG: hypothetical protein ACRDRI_05595 [Pseudonocardiaceae bacterium]
MTLLYSLGAAFEDVSLVVVRSSLPLDRDRRFRAASLLHTLVRAGWVTGLPDDPGRWPIGHPAAWVVASMRHAGPARPVSDDGPVPAESSPWALREAAREMRIALHLTAAVLDELPDAERAEEQRCRRLVEREIDDLLQQADYIEVDHNEIPTAGELADYDTALLARWGAR